MPTTDCNIIPLCHGERSLPCWLPVTAFRNPASGCPATTDPKPCFHMPTQRALGNAALRFLPTNQKMSRKFLLFNSPWPWSLISSPLILSKFRLLVAMGNCIPSVPWSLWAHHPTWAGDLQYQLLTLTAIKSLLLLGIMQLAGFPPESLPSMLLRRLWVLALWSQLLPCSLSPWGSCSDVGIWPPFWAPMGHATLPLIHRGQCFLKRFQGRSVFFSVRCYICSINILADSSYSGQNDSRCSFLAQIAYCSLCSPELLACVYVSQAPRSVALTNASYKHPMNTLVVVVSTTERNSKCVQYRPIQNYPAEKNRLPKWCSQRRASKMPLGIFARHR